jgi:hypothetical protein
MRSTVTIDSGNLKELMYETKARSKSSAVNEAIAVYLRHKKIEKIKSLKGKLVFDVDLDDLRHRER